MVGEKLKWVRWWINAYTAPSLCFKIEVQIHCSIKNYIPQKKCGSGRWVDFSSAMQQATPQENKIVLKSHCKIGCFLPFGSISFLLISEIELTTILASWKDSDSETILIAS